MSLFSYKVHIPAQWLPQELLGRPLIPSMRLKPSVAHIAGLKTGKINLDNNQEGR